MKCLEEARAKPAPESVWAEEELENEGELTVEEDGPVEMRGIGDPVSSSDVADPRQDPALETAFIARSESEADEGAGAIDASLKPRSLGTELAPYIDSAAAISAMTAASHPADEDAFALRMMIEAVIDVEGPVHQDVIADRVRTAYNLGRLRGQPRSRVLTLIREAGEGDRILRDGPFFYLDGQQLWNSSRIPRVAGPRSIDQIDSSELNAACLQIARAARISDPGELLRAVANAFGFDRIGGVIRHRLGPIARNVVTRLATDTDRTSLENDPSPAVSENLLVRLGYDPNLTPADRWMFFVNTAIPQIRREAAINSLNALMVHLNGKPDAYDEVLQAMKTDLEQLKRFRGA